MEFPKPKNSENAVYSVPKKNFRKRGERQASLAEKTVFDRLLGLKNAPGLYNLWLLFFHSSSYAGKSYRNQRCGKLMMREHDFVVFIRYQGKKIF